MFFAIGALFSLSLERHSRFLKTPIEDVKLKIAALYGAYAFGPTGLTRQDLVRVLGEYGVDDAFLADDGNDEVRDQFERISCSTPS